MFLLSLLNATKYFPVPNARQQDKKEYQNILKTDSFAIGLKFSFEFVLLYEPR